MKQKKTKQNVVFCEAKMNLNQNCSGNLTLFLHSDLDSPLLDLVIVHSASDTRNL